MKKEDVIALFAWSSAVLGVWFLIIHDISANGPLLFLLLGLLIFSFPRSLTASPKWTNELKTRGSLYRLVPTYVLAFLFIPSLLQNPFPVWAILIACLLVLIFVSMDTATLMARMREKFDKSSI